MCKVGDVVYTKINNAILKTIIVKKDKDKIYVTNLEKKDNKIYEISKKDILQIKDSCTEINVDIFWAVLFVGVCLFVISLSLLLLLHLKDVSPLF